MSSNKTSKPVVKPASKKMTTPVRLSKSVDVMSIIRHHRVKYNAMKALIATKKNESKVISDYVQIRPGDAKDVKSELPAEMSLLQEQLLSMRAVARAAIGAKLVKTKLFYEINTTATIATAYATAHPLAADNSSEFSALSGLYDEYRVLGGSVKFQELNSQGTPSTTSTWMAMGYDSTYSTTPTSVVEVLESDQSRLYGIAPQIANNFWAPYTAEAKGYFEFNFRVPQQSVLAATAVTGGDGVQDNFPGQWIAASSLAGTSVGYIRTYVQSSGSGNTITLRAIVSLEVEWRERT